MALRAKMTMMGKATSRLGRKKLCSANGESCIWLSNHSTVGSSSPMSYNRCSKPAILELNPGSTTLAIVWNKSVIGSRMSKVRLPKRAASRTVKSKKYLP